MSNFKRGDVVECIDDNLNYYNFIRGNRYIVLSTDKFDTKSIIRLTNENGYLFALDSYHFKLVSNIDKPMAHMFSTP